jgi:two-component sensor histidine kinase
LSDLKHQVDAIGLIHEKLYRTESITEIGCRDYISDLLNSVFSSFTSQRVRIEKSIEDINIPAKSAISLGLIINEIATNAIKHGFSDKEEAVFGVKMLEDKEHSRYEVTLRNIGNPFPENIDIEKSETLGMSIVTSLAAQLNGTITLQKTPHPVFTLRFPIG